ncbi:hypothetical protein VQ207_000292 [Salmonella enterica]|uniref:hypothetical protein n=1 Tax=Salmonella enterica TaxID=28901 RepID=UPI0008A8DA05|nr:hypothetical protein [Salmonella enterica]EAW2232893.1 hypothetical protein [Salmonella enterica subsp. enterica]EBH8830073.1 hypothetical protein [Salmonella enterica subsp. enterica serovar Anatum]EDD4939559.1 hypothetical protein [Salmonella enterica subsp. enterica serovar Typhimurium]EDT1462215.1 hypothetical protein [Salmonella enterica subsp. enterica serovar Braenderup]EDU7817615.1 hypothetical protein [Salmonella enterica subsp. enterica serovar Norwich]EEP3165287.1 hypothetical p
MKNSNMGRPVKITEEKYKEILIAYHSQVNATNEDRDELLKQFGITRRTFSRLAHRYPNVKIVKKVVAVEFA